MWNEFEFDYEYDDNLKEALSAVAEDDTEENWLEVICILKERLAADGEIIIPVAKLAFFKVEFDPDVQFEDIFPDTVEQDNYAVIEMPDHRRWMPLFTDEAELQDMAEFNDAIRIPVREAFEQVMANKRLSGILINVFSDIFLLSRPTIASLLEEADEGYDGFCDAG